MYRIMPEKQIGSWTVSNCAWSCFDQYANLLPFRLLSVKLKYPKLFLRLFDLLNFIWYYFVETWILSCEFKLQKGKTLRKRCVRNHGNMYLFCFTWTAYSPPFSGFRWRQKCGLWFLRLTACLFGHPVYFDYQDFLSFAFRLFIPMF